MLYRKIKAKYRDIEIPTTVLMYILMARTNIDRENVVHESQADYWKRWIRTKDENKELGYNVSRKIRKLVTEKILNVETDNHKLKKANESYESIKVLLKKMDLSPYGGWWDNLIKAQIELAQKVVPANFERQLASLINVATKMHETIKQQNEVLNNKKILDQHDKNDD
jgi:hypothetical protein